MSRLLLNAMAATAAAMFGTAVYAQQPGAPATPSPPPPEYGLTISQANAMKAATAAQAQAEKLGINVVITIVSPSGDLIYLTKMDKAQFGSIAVSQAKARAAAAFRRPSKAFEDAVAGGGPGLTVMTLPGVIASAGGVPIMQDGKIVGAIGCSGAPRGVIDEEACKAGADAVK
jgi:uncharacterized protein GlcG (DUF336 family)